MKPRRKIAAKPALAAVRAGKAPAQVAAPANRFYIGDCLHVLAGLWEKHGEFADLVYLDPPFNSGRLYNFALKGGEQVTPKVAFHDTWKWTPATVKDFNTFTRDEAPQTDAAELLKALAAYLEKRHPSMLAYLTYMARRLAWVRAAMKPDASIYLHCDPTASHYLKAMMDALLGRKNYCNEIVWCYTGPTKALRHFPRKHDVLLFYARNAERNTFNPDAVRIPYRGLNTQHGSDGDGGGIGGNLTQGVVDAYLARGKVPEDYWLEQDGLSPVGRIKSERIGFPTQKPIALLRRIITASSNPGDLVLDPFSGCGTTIQACHELGRRFVGIDVSRKAAEVITRRMRKKPGFGKLVVGDETPRTVRGWAQLLPDTDEPKGALALAKFQYDCIAAIPKAEQVEGRIQGVAKLGPDGGVDGQVTLKFPKTNARTSVVIQVKGKKNPGVEDVADTLLAVQNNNAFMGLLITLHSPTKEMTRRAEKDKSRFNGKGKYYPKVAILTYAQVKAGKYREAIPYAFAVPPEGGSQTGLDLPPPGKK